MLEATKGDTTNSEVSEDILNFHESKLIWESIIQHSILKSMTWDLCEVESSVIVLLKSKHCMKTNVEQEMRMAVFHLTPGSEKLCSV